MKPLGLLFLAFALLMITSCDETAAPTVAPEDGTPSSGVGSQILSNSPSLRMELNQLAASPSTSTQSFNSKSSVEGDLSVGGCLAWSTRKNAKVNVSHLQYMKCLYAAATDAGLIDLGEGETLYIDLDVGSSNPTRLTESNGVVTVSICYSDSTTENVRMTLQEEGDGYLVHGTSIIENGGGVGTDLYADVDLNTSTSGIEIYTFVNHFVVETDEDLCSGSSGTSLTEDDNTCFRRLEGTLTNNSVDSDNPFSILDGYFAEKNSAGVRTTSSAYSKFVGGVGATVFSAGLDGVDGDVNANPTVDSWVPTDFITTAAATFVDDVSSQTLTTRTVTLPSIESPWDCQGEAVEIELSDFLSFASELICEVEGIDSADMTNCTGGNDELTEVVEGYLCDEDDPLIDTSSQNCP